MSQVRKKDFFKRGIDVAFFGFSVSGGLGFLQLVRDSLFSFIGASSWYIIIIFGILSVVILYCLMKIVYFLYTRQRSFAIISVALLSIVTSIAFLIASYARVSHYSEEYKELLKINQAQASKITLDRSIIDIDISEDIIKLAGRQFFTPLDTLFSYAEDGYFSTWGFAESGFQANFIENDGKNQREFSCHENYYNNSNGRLVCKLKSGEMLLGGMNYIRKLSVETYGTYSIVTKCSFIFVADYDINEATITIVLHDNYTYNNDSLKIEQWSGKEVSYKPIGTALPGLKNLGDKKTTIQILAKQISSGTKIYISWKNDCVSIEDCDLSELLIQYKL